MEACWGSLGARVEAPHSYPTQGSGELGSWFPECCPRDSSPWCSWLAVPMGGATKPMGKGLAGASSLEVGLDSREMVKAKRMWVGH